MSTNNNNNNNNGNGNGGGGIRRFILDPKASVKTYISESLAEIEGKDGKRNNYGQQGNWQQTGLPNTQFPGSNSTATFAQQSIAGQPFNNQGSQPQENPMISNNLLQTAESLIHRPQTPSISGDSQVAHLQLPSQDGEQVSLDIAIHQQNHGKHNRHHNNQNHNNFPGSYGPSINFPGDQYNTNQQGIQPQNIQYQNLSPLPSPRLQPQYMAPGGPVPSSPYLQPSYTPQQGGLPPQDLNLNSRYGSGLPATDVYGSGMPTPRIYHQMIVDFETWKVVFYTAKMHGKQVELATIAGRLKALSRDIWNLRWTRASEFEESESVKDVIVALWQSEFKLWSDILDSLYDPIQMKRDAIADAENNYLQLAGLDGALGAAKVKKSSSKTSADPEDKPKKSSHSSKSHSHSHSDPDAPKTKKKSSHHKDA